MDACSDVSTCPLGGHSSDASHVAAPDEVSVMGVGDRVFLYIPRLCDADPAEVTLWANMILGTPTECPADTFAKLQVRSPAVFFKGI